MIASDKTSSFWKLIIAIVICETTGIISGLISQVGMDRWFMTIDKPSWNPPAYLFGPVWTSLYLLMGISLWLIWDSNVLPKIKTKAIAIFSLQLFLNFCWSIIFFRFHSPVLALIDIILMVITIVITIILFNPISRVASWLLIPYLFWVCFATFLNYAIWSLNR